MSGTESRAPLTALWEVRSLICRHSARVCSMLIITTIRDVAREVRQSHLQPKIGLCALSKFWGRKRILWGTGRQIRRGAAPYCSDDGGGPVWWQGYQMDPGGVLEVGDLGEVGYVKWPLMCTYHTLYSSWYRECMRETSLSLGGDICLSVGLGFAIWHARVRDESLQRATSLARLDNQEQGHICWTGPTGRKKRHLGGCMEIPSRLSI